MSYVVGFDGGGTKTNAEARALDGTVLARGIFGAMNLNGSEQSAVQSTMNDCITWLSTLPDGISACNAICIGSAGISNPDASELLRRSVACNGYNGKLILLGDHETALAGALGTPYGAVLIAGTGSICFGQGENKSTMRTGGFGHLVDDEGSGYAIGRDILATVLRAYDKRVAESILSELLLKQTGFNDAESIVKFVYSPNTSKKDIAALAPLLDKALKCGDMAAQIILKKVCSELKLLVLPVIHALHLESESLALMGSILTKSKAINKTLQDSLSECLPFLTCISPKADAASGAAIMALQAL